MVSKVFLSHLRLRGRLEAKLHCSFIDLFSLLTRYLLMNKTFAEWYWVAEPTSDQ